MNLRLLWCALLLGAIAAAPQDHSAAPRPAPDFALPAADGRTIRLSDQLNKVVVLEFLQTTCPICQESGKMLQKIYETRAGRGVEIIGISHDRAGLPALRNYVSEHKLTYPVVLGDMEVGVNYLGVGPAKPSFHVPVFIFIDRRGRVVEERTLENPNHREWYNQMPGSLEAVVDRLLGSPRSKVQSPKPKAGTRR